LLSTASALCSHRANAESRCSSIEHAHANERAAHSSPTTTSGITTRQQQQRREQQQGSDRSGNASSGSAPSTSRCRSAPRTPPGSIPRDNAPDGQAADGAGLAWHEVSAKLAALRVRAQRVAVNNGAASAHEGGGCGDSLAALAQQAGTPHERLLVAKLMEASNIMQEQEQTLKMAISALAGGGATSGAAAAPAGGSRTGSRMASARRSQE